MRSKRAGERVLYFIERFLAKRLKLRVNREKIAVAKPQERSFLGFSFTSGEQPRVKLSTKVLKRVKRRIRSITRRSRGVISLEQVIEEFNTFLGGWLGYYRLIETPTVLWDLQSWIRRRLRCFMVKRWINNCHTRFKRLVALGVSPVNASR